MKKTVIALMLMLVMGRGAYAQTVDSTQTRTDVIKLKAIAIKAPKHVYSMDGEVVSYNVANDVTVRGLTAMDALQNAPTVEVDIEGNITMRGSEQVEVWLNGYPTGMNGVSLKAFFESLPADAIERIEVIKNPSAQYMVAEGKHIINIVTSRKLRNATLLLLGVSGNSRPYVSPWASYVFKGDRLTMNLYVNGSNTHYNTNEHGHATHFRQVGTERDTTLQSTYRDTASGHDRSGMMWLNMNYKFNASTDVNVMAMNLVQQALGTVDNREGEYWQRYPDTLHYGQHDHELQRRRHLTGFTVVDLKHRFARKGQNVSIGLNSNYSAGMGLLEQQRNYTLLDGTPAAALNGYGKRGENRDNSVKVSVNATYNHPVGERDELTLRANAVPVERSLKAYERRFADDEGAFSVPDTLRNGNEVTRGTSASLAASWRHKWERATLEVGMRGNLRRMRLENSTLFADSATFRFLTAQPSANLTWRTRKMHHFRLKYSLDVTTPTAANLTVSRRYGEEGYSVGNRELRNSRTHNVAMSWNRYFDGGSSVGVESYAKVTTDGIETVTASTGETDPYLQRVVSYTMPYNVGSWYKTGVEGNVSYRPAAWMNVRLYANVYHQGYRMEQTGSGTTKEEGTTCNLRLNVWGKIAKRVSVNVSGGYSTRTMTLYGEKGDTYELGIGVSGTFFDERLSAYVNVSDPFNWNRVGNRIAAPLYESWSTARRDSRYVTLGMSWRIGKSELEWRARKGAAGE